MFRSTIIAALLIAPAVALAASTSAAGGRGARLAEQFKQADADGNGMLSRADAEKSAPRLAGNFDAIDANRDGQLSPEEIRAHRRAAKSERRARAGAGGAGATAKFDQYFARADRDGDGALSRAEAENGMPRVAKKFDRIDTDRDGKVTRDEMRVWLAARRAARTGKTG